jgi:hypothetical protein
VRSRWSSSYLDAGSRCTGLRNGAEPYLPRPQHRTVLGLVAVQFTAHPNGLHDAGRSVNQSTNTGNDVLRHEDLAPLGVVRGLTDQRSRCRLRRETPEARDGLRGPEDRLDRDLRAVPAFPADLAYGPPSWPPILGGKGR